MMVSPPLPPPAVFHSHSNALRQKTHTVLVRPEYGGNIGSVARALANMGIGGSLRIVGSPQCLDTQAWRMAKHAGSRLKNALFFDSLESALRHGATNPLVLASTARTGSAQRPHPLPVSIAVPRALDKLAHDEVSELFFVFGPESDGLSNAEIDLCDWVVTIPSSDEYRSLNLAQAVLIFSYEVNRLWTEQPDQPHTGGRTQRDRLIAHFIRVAEEAGFILPSDPYKMRPRLEQILQQLPPHMQDVQTLHGLLDQVRRSVRAGGPDWKGRYRHRMTAQTHGAEGGLES